MIISPKIKPFRFWSQKVIPLVYDDSLSYYEVLSKLTDKMNELIGYITNNIQELVAEALESFFLNMVYVEATQTIKFDYTEGE